MDGSLITTRIRYLLCMISQIKELLVNTDDDWFRSELTNSLVSCQKEEYRLVRFRNVYDWIYSIVDIEDDFTRLTGNKFKINFNDTIIIVDSLTGNDVYVSNHTNDIVTYIYDNYI
jgi:hypothetical protein